MRSKVVKVDVIPCRIVPAILLLDVLSIVIAVYMETDARVEFSRDRFSIYMNGALLRLLMINEFCLFEAAMSAVSSRQKIGVDVQSGGKRKTSVRSDLVLVSLDPGTRERASKRAQRGGNDGKEIRIRWHVLRSRAALGVVVDAINSGATVGIPPKLAAVA